MVDPSRSAFRVWLVALVGVLLVVALAGPGRDAGTTPETTRPVLRSATVADDAGDGLATTTYDGPMVHRRAAIGIHPVAGADRDVIRRQLRAAAAKEKVGPLSNATFAVFSEELLTYLVPEIVVVLPEGASLADAELLMRDHRYPTVAFHLVESVLVHDLTFAVIPDATPPAVVRDRIEREGVLADSLGRHRLTVQKSGLTVSYFGALLSDGQILAVREAMARAAAVAVDRVVVTPTSPAAGVDLSSDTGARQGAHQHD
jgi:hypothetical protein